MVRGEPSRLLRGCAEKDALRDILLARGGGLSVPRGVLASKGPKRVEEGVRMGGGAFISEQTLSARVRVEATAENL